MTAQFCGEPTGGRAVDDVVVDRDGDVDNVTYFDLASDNVGTFADAPDDDDE